MHTCDDISITEILYHYHDMEYYITIIDISIILHITKKYSHYTSLQRDWGHIHTYMNAHTYVRT